MDLRYSEISSIYISDKKSGILGGILFKQYQNSQSSGAGLVGAEKALYAEATENSLGTLLTETARDLNSLRKWGEHGHGSGKGSCFKISTPLKMYVQTQKSQSKSQQAFWV